MIAWNPRGDDSGSEDALNFRPRDLNKTLTDMIRWMLEAGHITDRQAGKITKS